MPLLDARELYRFYHAGDEEVRALRGVSLAIGPGEMVALVGPSGSGKSTLLMCLAGLDEPDGGMVKVMDCAMTRRPESEKTKLRAKHLGVMRQKDNLFPHLTVLENVLIARRLADGGEETEAVDVLDRIGMAARKSSLPAQLSGGEQARAGLAVAMACDPRILLLDEPTGETDATAEEAILAVLNEFRKGGGAAIVTTHNPAIARMATRTLAMLDGKILDG
jgi:putative ABC transport system ATP-binding protein